MNKHNRSDMWYYHIYITPCLFTPLSHDLGPNIDQTLPVVLHKEISLFSNLQHILMTKQHLWACKYQTLFFIYNRIQ